MSNLNRVLLTGNLTDDPNLKYVGDNTPVCNFALATNRHYRNRQGEQQQEVCYVDCEAWGHTAEVIHQRLSKGRPLLIEGRLRLDRWKTKAGENRSKLRVVAERFHFIDRKTNREPGDVSEQTASPAAAAEDAEDIPF